MKANLQQRAVLLIASKAIVPNSSEHKNPETLTSLPNPKTCQYNHISVHFRSPSTCPANSRAPRRAPAGIHQRGDVAAVQPGDAQRYGCGAYRGRE